MTFEILEARLSPGQIQADEAFKELSSAVESDLAYLHVAL